MNLIRKLKISKILNQPLEGVDKEIVDFIESKISNLTELKIDKIPNYTFYMNKGGEYILEFKKHNLKNEKLYVRYNDFWEILGKNIQ